MVAHIAVIRRSIPVTLFLDTFLLRAFCSAATSIWVFTQDKSLYRGVKVFGTPKPRGDSSPAKSGGLLAHDPEIGADDSHYAGCTEGMQAGCGLTVSAHFGAGD